MTKQTDTEKSGLKSRMEDFYFEIESPDGEVQVFDSATTQNSGEEED
jgi:hypothetical protein